MNKISLNFIVIIIAISCVQKIVSKKEYFESGLIKSISYFHSESDQLPYTKISYYESGIVEDSCYYNKKGNLDGRVYSYNNKEDYKKWTQYFNGIRNGRSIVEFNNGRKVIQFFKNDTLNGVEYQYDATGKISREVLWINDRPIVLKDIIYPKIGDTLLNFVRKGNKFENELEILKDTIQLNAFFKIKEHDRYPMGSLRFNKYNKIINSNNNSYVTVNLTDTIYDGELLPVSIKGYFGNFKDVTMDCVIENLNNKVESKEQTSHYTTSVGYYDLFFKISKYKPGYNILLGKIYLKRDTTILHEVLFYKDFYVLKR